MKSRLLLGFFLFLFSGLFVSASSADDARLDMPETCAAGEKVVLKATAGRALPASSFFRVNLNCPDLPDGGLRFESGYPESDVIFTKPGSYECQAELGIVSKSSCAGVSYFPIYARDFLIKVK